MRSRGAQTIAVAELARRIEMEAETCRDIAASGSAMARRPGELAAWGYAGRPWPHRARECPDRAVPRLPAL